MEGAANFAINGTLVDVKRKTPIRSAKVTLFSYRGLRLQATKVSETRSDESGRFGFDGLEPPTGNRFNRLQYLIKATAPGCVGAAIPVRTVGGGNNLRVGLVNGSVMTTGKVVDEVGRPVAGATVDTSVWFPSEQIGLPSFVTDDDGLFILPRTAEVESEQAAFRVFSLSVRHDDFPFTIRNCETNNDLRVVVRKGCRVEGVVLDAESKSPLNDVVVSLIPHGPLRSPRPATTTTDENGRYRLNVIEGTYRLLIDDERYVAAAQIFRLKRGTETIADPLLAQAGGFIVGQVIDTSDGKPKSFHEDRNGIKRRIYLGAFGPGRPKGRTIRQTDLAGVDDEGRFRIRVMPGKNFPYFQNLRGNRTAFNTSELPPVDVVAGEETVVEMTYTRPPNPRDKLAAARAILVHLPDSPEERVESILNEFRRLNETVAECETWCLLIKELHDIGEPAVMPLCRELESTDQQLMLRRISFALRAIGDARAVPALIRSLPKTL
ncbi:MAG: carboxypeptidase regulatory-like domain-containing protein, partial [Planctomycetota bacterium]